jgi:preprotein translocase subunit SecE
VPQTRQSPRLAKTQPRVQRAAPAAAGAAARSSAPAGPSLASRLAIRAPRQPFGRRGVGVVNYFTDVRSELRKVVWPTKDEAIKLTAVVVGLSAIVGLYLGFLDFVFGELVAAILRFAAGS